jgi:uncharacterized membrane protein YeaQ/YmgE (transglycosylase-associated protein family)
VALVFVPALDRLQDLSRLPQGRENEVGVGTDGGGVWAVSAVGSCARVPKRRVGPAPCNRVISGLASLLRWQRRVVLSLIRRVAESDVNESQNVTCTGYTDELARMSKEVLMDTMAVTEFLARSTTLTSVGWIGYIVIGAIAGWVAKHFMHVHENFVVTILVGIAGALIGGFILSFFVNTEKGGWWFTLFTAILGSVILLGLLRLVRRPTRLGR